MRRTPIVLAGTAAGLAAVLGFHTESLGTNVVATPSGSSSGASTGKSTTTTTGSSSSPGRVSSSASTTTTTTGTTGTRTALGADVQYRYGDLELQVTVTGSRITNVEPVVDTAYDPRSSQINSYAEPLLVSETIEAQSAAINGVSGATFTSQAYVQSLQAALDKLGIK
ncbi:MAG: FMN-binding protein [Acidimicrobiales bacterium]|jgi:uncharacterized protein with FMN-binding domain